MRLSRISSLFDQYARSLQQDLSYQDFASEIAALPGRYGAPDGALLIATAPDGATLGCVALRRLSDDTAEMKRLYVQPEARGTGLGWALALAAIATARIRGYATLVLDTLAEMRAAQSLYAALGFKATEPYYEPTPHGTVFMALRLDDTPEPRVRSVP